MNNLTATTSLLTSNQFFLSFRPGFSLAELPFDEFALDSSVAETLSEQVLGPVTPSVATIAAHWHNHLLVSSVVREHSLETVTEREEVVLGCKLCLEHFGFKLGAREGQVSALSSSTRLWCDQVSLDYSSSLCSTLCSFTVKTHRFVHKSGPECVISECCDNTYFFCWKLSFTNFV